MPELPEVETIVRDLRPLLVGRSFGPVLHVRPDIVHGDPRPLTSLLPRRRVVDVSRRAKRIILSLKPTAELIFHLGMSGRLTVVDRDVLPESHTHLRVAIRGTRCELRFRDPRRFGGVWCLAGHKTHVGRRLGPLGVEPLETTPAVFRQLLGRRRQIKALLLDQRIIAGIGNIYCDEALHAAGIHPQTRADELERGVADRLLRKIKSVLNKAIRFNGSTLVDYRRADGSEGSFRQHHRVYARTGDPCRTCGSPIECFVAAGRSTFICPRCQPGGGRD